MPLAKSQQPVAFTSTSSARPTTTSVRSRPTTTTATAAPQTASPALQLELPPPLPTITELQITHRIQLSPQLIARRLVSLARSFLSLHPNDATPDPLDWELDLCSATFFAIYAVCLDPPSTAARRTLARCARLGGFNIVLPFSPSGSAASASVSAAKLSSQDSHDLAGAQACIHILQQGSAATFQDAGSAREYRDASRTLSRSSDAIQVADILKDKVLGKRKAIDISRQDVTLPQLISTQSRFHSQLQTDDGYQAASRDRTDDARSSFCKALEQDPFNWRAWTGLCDTGYGAGSADKHFGDSTLERLYTNLVIEVQTPYSSMEAALRVSAPFSTEQPQPSTMIRKVSEDGSNKKLRVSSKVPPLPTLGAAAAARYGAASKPMDKLTPPLPTTSASTVTATRLHPASRALSAAQTNTHHLEPMSTDQDDVKASKVGTLATCPTRTTTVRTVAVSNPATIQNGRPLRSTRGNPTARVSGSATRAGAAPSRAGVTSAAGSVSSTSSGSSTSSISSRTTVPTARSAVSTRRVATSAPNQAPSRNRATKPATATIRVNTTNATAPSTKRTTATTAVRPTASSTAGSLSRPGSAMSKASSTSMSGPSSSARTNGALASSRTAAEAMRQKEEDNARLKLAQLSSLRETCLQQLTTLAHQHAADRYVLALLSQVGEAYRLLRVCEGDKAAAVLLQPVLAAFGAESDGKAEKSQLQLSDAAEEGSLVTPFKSEASRLIDLQVKDSLLQHLLLGRSYAESSQYASAETHFTAARKLNPCIASHMDVYSLVLFHLSREVKLSALAQHLAMVAPGTASTHIVVGNAFSLQKEHQTALVCFQRAAAAAPEYAYAFTLAGHEAHDLGLHDEAIAYFRSAIRCDRRHWNAWAGLGRVYLGIGEHEHAACKSLQQAIHINPGNHILWDLVGWTFSLINAPAKALECYDRAIELAPSASVLTYLHRAELLLQHGDTESSHRDLVRAHDLAPEEASIHILLAQSYMRLGGGAFCHLESSGAGGAGGSGAAKASAARRASGAMALPSAFQAEITHHLSVAIDLDPSVLRVVKGICEGYKTLPGSKLSIHPHDLTSASFSQSHLSMADCGMYNRSGMESESQAVDSQSQMGGHSGDAHQSYSYSRGSGMAVNSAPQHSHMHAGIRVPSDFANSHPPSGVYDSSSLLSITMPLHSGNNIVLEDAEVSS